MIQALGLTHWNAAACQKLIGFSWLIGPPPPRVLAIFQARYSR
jgi:hypothetical protein